LLPVDLLADVNHSELLIARPSKSVSAGKYLTSWNAFPQDTIRPQKRSAHTKRERERERERER